MTVRPQRRPSRGPAPRAGEASARADAKPEPARFDAHRWFERYAASHHDADRSDRLAGVPFN